MPIQVDNFDDLRKHLIEAAAILGRRFLFGPEITAADNHSGWHDAWFDAKIPGLVKLNCFFTVPQALYDEVKRVHWSPLVNKNVYRRPKGRGDKGVDGTVICNGDATPASRSVMSVLGTNETNERFETALYENRLYKPVQLNLELKLVSKTLNAAGKPVEAIVVNAHIEPKGK